MNFCFMIIIMIYCHLSKLSVGQTPRLCNVPIKSIYEKADHVFGFIMYTLWSCSTKEYFSNVCISESRVTTRLNVQLGECAACGNDMYKDSSYISSIGGVGSCTTSHLVLHRSCRIFYTVSLWRPFVRDPHDLNFTGRTFLPTTSSRSCRWLKDTECGNSSVALFMSVPWSEGRQSLAMVCSTACNEKVGCKKPGTDPVGWAAQKKKKT